MRILDRHLFSELTLTWLAVALVLVLIIFGTQVGQLLQMAVQGGLPPSLLGLQLLYRLPPALEVVLPVTVLLGVLLTFGRWYQDQEMVVWHSCGVGLDAFRRRVLLFALPIAALTLFNDGWLAPLSTQKARLSLVHAKATAPFAAVRPGRFNPLGEAGVFYAAALTRDGQLRQVWLRYPLSTQELVVTAPRGRLVTRGERVAVQLDDAWALSRQADGTTTLRHFERFEGFVPQLSARMPRRSDREMTLPQLWKNPAPPAQALLHQKLTAPLTVVAMALLGLAASRTRPREGRFARVFYALLVYVLYFQLMTLFQDRVHHGDTRWVVALWALPAAAIVVLWQWGRRR
ncbi:LPS export ABC transporter permease LptF [Sulfurivirga sp.]|uniref:LPS export ABC transporter permease LptF n=1 Tax=Sulfurivirga sp. TaxID=2614236 RepID=UPI0025F461E5|nr:LPS export ABC transporter permease LptF [Sulfurivirga sp.]